MEVYCTNIGGDELARIVVSPTCQLSRVRDGFAKAMQEDVARIAFILQSGDVLGKSDMYKPVESLPFTTGKIFPAYTDAGTFEFAICPGRPGLPPASSSVPLPASSSGLFALAEHCAHENSILQFAAGTMEHQRHRFVVALHFCSLVTACAQNLPARVCILGASAPTVGKFADFASGVPSLSSELVLNTAETEVWSGVEWQAVLQDTHVLIVTPMLFRIALDRNLVSTGQFRAFVFDECQHCTGSHPYAQIIRDHMQFPCGHKKPRILGITSNFVKQKYRGTAQEPDKIAGLKHALQAGVVDAHNLFTARVSTAVVPDVVAEELHTVKEDVASRAGPGGAAAASPLCSAETMLMRYLRLPLAAAGPMPAARWISIKLMST